MTVESLVARCLVDPGYLAGLIEASPTGTTDELLDLNRIRLFGGLITKVQHNDLWDDFPYTRAALKLIGCELALFADYRDPHMRLREGKPDRPGRVTSFLDFVAGWLAEHQPLGGGAVLDISRHERLLWETRIALAGLVVDGSPAPDRLRPAGVLAVAGLNHDPGELIAAVRLAQPLDAITPRPVFACYWGTSREEEIRVIEVDALTAAVLAEIGTGIVARELRARLGALYPELPPATVGEVLAAAFGRGLLVGSLA